VSSDKRVLLYDMLRRRVRRAAPDDVVFRAQRTWDHGSEAGFMKRIENAFQDLAAKIIDGRVSTIGDEDKRIANEFFALWYMRSRHRVLVAQEIRAIGVSGGGLSKDQEEMLEKRGILFAREDGRFPARQLRGLALRVRTYHYAHKDLSVTRWGIIQAQHGEFVVPDVPLHTIIPLTPTQCLASPASDGMISKQNLAEVNRNLIAASQAYFFAHDFRECPGYGDPRQAGGRNLYVSRPATALRTAQQGSPAAARLCLSDPGAVDGSSAIGRPRSWRHPDAR
jgi:hypothetical protein